MGLEDIPTASRVSLPLNPPQGPAANPQEMPKQQWPLDGSRAPPGPALSGLGAGGGQCPQLPEGFCRGTPALPCAVSFLAPAYCNNQHFLCQPVLTFHLMVLKLVLVSCEEGVLPTVLPAAYFAKYSKGVPM